MSLSSEPLEWYRNALKRGAGAAVRERAGLTVADAAARSGILRDVLWAWESGRKEPGDDAGRRYADMLVAAGATTCRACGRERPANFFWLIKNPGGTFRALPECIPCRSAAQAKRWALQENPQAAVSNRRRVKEYQKDPDVKARRAKRAAAQYRALVALRDAHPAEYAAAKAVGSEYAALAAVRDAHRPQYQEVYEQCLKDVGLAA